MNKYLIELKEIMDFLEDINNLLLEAIIINCKMNNLLKKYNIIKHMTLEDKLSSYTKLKI